MLDLSDEALIKGEKKSKKKKAPFFCTPWACVSLA